MMPFDAWHGRLNVASIIRRPKDRRPAGHENESVILFFRILRDYTIGPVCVYLDENLRRSGIVKKLVKVEWPDLDLPAMWSLKIRFYMDTVLINVH